MHARLLEWHEKLADLYFVEVLTVLLGLTSSAFGATLIILPGSYAGASSFAQAFRWVAPHWWGLAMVVLGIAMMTLLTHSRAAAAIPTFLLSAVWVLWVVPIALSPGFVPSAPIVYTALSLFSLAIGAACLVKRKVPIRA